MIQEQATLNTFENKHGINKKRQKKKKKINLEKFKFELGLFFLNPYFQIKNCFTEQGR